VSVVLLCTAVDVVMESFGLGSGACYSKTAQQVLIASMIVPVGYMQETEANIRRDSKVQVLAASRQVQGTHGPGQGCLLTGAAEILIDGDLVARVKEEFPWARGAMLIRVESAKTQL
jgi:hypothetical protein